MLSGKTAIAIALGCAFTLSVLATSASAQATGAGPYYAQPSWDQQIPAAQRFIVLTNWVDQSFPGGGAAVLDRETGLVWQRSPSMTADIFPHSSLQCQQAATGGRFGWRMPQTEELFSLLDPSKVTEGANGPPALPTGHPFMNVGGTAYWVKDRELPPFNSDSAVFIVFVNVAIINTEDPTATRPVWCVRGPGGSPTPW